jgi:hypothetical protein
MSKDTIGIIRVLSAWAVGDLKDGEHDEIAALQVMSEGRIEEALSSYFSMPLNRFVIKKAITKPISQLTQDDRDIVAEFAKIRRPC